MRPEQVEKGMRVYWVTEAVTGGTKHQFVVSGTAQRRDPRNCGKWILRQDNELVVSKRVKNLCRSEAQAEARILGPVSKP